MADRLKFATALMVMTAVTHSANVNRTALCAPAPSQSTTSNVTFCRGQIQYTTPRWLRNKAADELAAASMLNYGDSECLALRSKLLHCWIQFPQCEESDGSQHRICRSSCFSTAHWAGCSHTLPEVVAFCSTNSFSDDLNCFDPLATGSTVPFKQLMEEIMLGAAMALAFWILLACAPRCIGAIFAPKAPRTGADGYEEVPLEHLGADAGEAEESDGASSSPPSNECRICKEEEEPGSDNLIEPCKCRGSMRKVHPECLKRWIETKAVEMGDGTEIPMQFSCEVCLEEYAVAMQLKFKCDAERLCGKESWAEYCNCILLLCLLPLIFVALWLSCKQAADHKEGLCKEEGHWTLVAIGVLLCLMFISTLHKITSRWWLLNQDLEFTSTR